MSVMVSVGGSVVLPLGGAKVQWQSFPGMFTLSQQGVAKQNLVCQRDSSVI